MAAPDEGRKKLNTKMRRRSLNSADAGSRPESGGTANGDAELLPDNVAASEAVDDAHKYEGTIKSYDEVKGFGFIQSEALFQVYRGDAFLHHKQKGNFIVGDSVMFTVLLNGRGQPQAYNLVPAELGVGAAAGMPLEPSAEVQAVNPCRPDVNGTPAATRRSSAAAESGRPLTDAVRHEGHVKCYDAAKGYGFIASPGAYERYGADIFVYQSQIGNFTVNDNVSFAVRLNGAGKPRAHDLRRLGPACVESSGAAARGANEAGAGIPKRGTSSSSGAKIRCPMPPQETAESRTQHVAAVASTVKVAAPAPVEDCATETPSRAGRRHKGALQESIVHEGRIKMVDEDKGFGFVSCPELYDLYRSDIYVDKKHMTGFGIGDAIHFSVKIQRGKPQAVDLRLSTPDEGVFTGTVKSFDLELGYGFISSVDVRDRYQRDVFLHAKQVKNFRPGDHVAFIVRVNNQQQPQAYSLREAPDTVGWLAEEDTSKQVDSEEEFTGVIKFLSRHDGYGFIECQKLQERFRRDVYINESNYAGLTDGSRVRFRVKVKRGQPQAHDVVLVAPPSRGCDSRKVVVDSSGLEIGDLNKKLLRACASARVDSVNEIEQLLLAGADANAKDVTGQKALMVSALNVRQAEKKSRLLVQHRADPMAAATESQNVLQWARERVNHKFAAFLEALHRGEEPDCTVTLDRPPAEEY